MTSNTSSEGKRVRILLDDGVELAGSGAEFDEGRLTLFDDLGGIAVELAPNSSCVGATESFVESVQ